MEQKINAIVDRKMAKAMRKVAKQDLKIYNLQTASTGFNYDAGSHYINHATVITTGTGVGNRIGNEIRLLRLKWQYAFLAGDNYNVVRFLIVRAKSAQVPSTTSTMSANVLSGVTGSLQVYAPVDSLSWDVLHDELMEVHYAPVDGSTAATTQIPRTSQGCIDLGNVLLKYSQQTSTAITGKQVVLLFISDSVIAPNPSVQGFSTVEFTEA